MNPSPYRQSWSGRDERRSRYGDDDFESGRHYSYEDEDQSARPYSSSSRYGAPASRYGSPSRPAAAKTAKPQPGSLDNIAQFFSSKGNYSSRPKLEVPEATGATGFRNGQKVRHPKYGEGIVFQREGDGDAAKVTVQFAKFGVKKLVEKFANLEKV
jgi:DNA helicase II / ATP-dependent DNA helicase PcrA